MKKIILVIVLFVSLGFQPITQTVEAQHFVPLDQAEFNLVDYRHGEWGAEWWDPPASCSESTKRCWVNIHRVDPPDLRVKYIEMLPTGWNGNRQQFRGERWLPSFGSGWYEAYEGGCSCLINGVQWFREFGHLPTGFPIGTWVYLPIIDRP